MKTVFLAIPKYLHFAKDHIARYALENDAAPLSPYGVPFWMLDTVEREKIRAANQTYLEEAEEVWIFGSDEDLGEHTTKDLSVTDGVKEEEELAKKKGKTIRYFRVDLDTQEIHETTEE